MRLVVSAILLTVIVALSGCSQVSGNYPVPKVRPPELPEQYAVNGEPMPKLFGRSGRVQMFALGWQDPADQVTLLRNQLNAGEKQAEVMLRFLEPLAESGMVVYRTAVFVHKDTEMPVPLGRVNISFSDGSSVTDRGAFFVERDKGKLKIRDSRRNTVKLQSKYATDIGKPVVLRFILPAEHMGKNVASVDYVRN